MKMQNTLSALESLLQNFNIPEGITIEYVGRKPSETKNLPDQIEDEDEGYDDCGDSDFIPVEYCAITMDVDDKKDDAPRSLPATNIGIDSLVETSKSKKSTKSTESNENSSFVCNGATRPTGRAKKRFECHICQKTFGWTTDLKRHILIHTGERPFKCSLCFATFTRNFLLQKHKTKIHQCLSPNEVLQLNSNVAKNVMEIKLKMKELEQAKDSSVGVAGEESESGMSEV